MINAIIYYLWGDDMESLTTREAIELEIENNDMLLLYFGDNI